MEGLGIAASIIAVLQIAETAIEIFNDIKDASIERIRVHAEILSTRSLLVLLQERLRDGSLATVEQLGGPNGPLRQLEDLLQELIRRMKPQSRAREIGRAIKWHFDKSSVAAMLARIDRLKNLLILALANDQVALSTMSQADVKQVLDVVNRVEDGQVRLQQQTKDRATSRERTEKERLREDITKWLNSADPSSNYHAALDRRQHDTGTWFLNDSLYEQWKATAGHFIWLHGKMGCGKSILSSTIIEDVMKHTLGIEKAIVVYFYFDFNDEAKQKHSDLLASLIVQVFSACTEIPPSILDLHSKHARGGKQPRYDALLDCLEELIAEYQNFYLIIDALDECPTRDKLLPWIDRTLSSGTVRHRLHLLVLSRKERDIEQTLEPHLTESQNGTQIGINDDTVDADIRTFVRAQLDGDTRLRKWPILVQRQIEDSLLQKANGMFRWAYCQLDALRKCLSKRDIEKALASLPRSLDETYSRILRNIEEGDHVEDASRILTWLCYAKRPIRLDEMLDVLAIDTEELHHFDPEQRLLEPRDILTICSSFIDIVYRKRGMLEVPDQAITNSERSLSQKLKEEDPDEVQEVRLAHLSVREYLVSNRNRHALVPTEQSGNAKITLHCLYYLSQFNGSGCSGSDWHHVYTSRPATRYCASHWWRHMRDAGARECLGQVKALALDVITNPYVFNYLILFNDELWTNLSDWRVRFLTDFLKDKTLPLLFAAYCGLRCLAEKSLKDGAKVNRNLSCYEDSRPGFIFSTLSNALHVACFRGNLEMVQLLVGHGAELTYSSHTYNSALSAAVVGGHVQIVEYLISIGADIGAREEFDTYNFRAYWGDALELSISQGHVEILKILLDRGATYTSALLDLPWHRSCAFQMTQLLVEKGAAIDSRDGWKRTPLHQAAHAGQAEIVTLLLTHGAAIDAQERSGETPLMEAVQAKAKKTIVTLLVAGADVNARNHEGRAALHFANANVTDTLLSNGANPEVRDFRGVSFLQQALEKPDVEKAIILLKCRSSHEAKHYYGEEVLDILIKMNNGEQFKDLLTQLIRDGVYAGAQDYAKRSFLSLAINMNNLGAVRLLLTNHADPFLRDGFGRNAMQHALQNESRYPDPKYDRPSNFERSKTRSHIIMLLQDYGVADVPFLRRVRSWPWPETPSLGADDTDANISPMERPAGIRTSTGTAVATKTKTEPVPGTPRRKC